MEAIVLSRRDFREGDQVVSFYTKELGKLELVAKGVKKMVSKNSAHLEPFSIVDIEIAGGKQFDYVTTVGPVEYFSKVRQDLPRALVAQFSVNLADRVLKVGEQDERFFWFIKNWLELISVLDEVKPVFLDSFVLKLFSLLGFHPELKSCVVCGTTSDLNGFYFAGGGVICDECRVKKERVEEEVLDFTPDLNIGFGVLLDTDWDLVSQLDLTDKLHNLVYEYVIFHHEKEIADWGKLARFG